MSSSGLHEMDLDRTGRFDQVIVKLSALGLLERRNANSEAGRQTPKIADWAQVAVADAQPARWPPVQPVRPLGYSIAD